MPHKHLTAAIAAGLFVVAGLLPAVAVPRWVPLPVAKSAALSSAPLPGDPVRGATLFARCQACHETGETAGHRVGPALTGILGRPAAAYRDYDYSGALAQAGSDGLIWTREFLNEYLESPSKFMPEGTMAFVGLDNDTDRTDLIAYLANLKAPKTAPWLFRNQSRAEIPLPARSPITR
ncbi:MAG: c-type cytochrome [Alphaproteobacteria bacterium]|nr:c-type cytochrome [Alphaproteobacteria bacterium]